MRKALLESRALYFKIAPQILTSTSYYEYKNEIKLTISTLNQWYKRYSSPTIGFYLWLLQIEWLDMHYKYQASKILLSKLMNLVLNKPSVYTKSRHCEVILNISQNDIIVGRYSDAKSNAILAQKYLEINSTNYNLAKEQEFYARLYCNELIESEIALLGVIENTNSMTTPFMYSKRIYLLACLKTIQGEINRSNELLEQVTEFRKDKDGWNIRKRILTIMNGIEIKDYEGVDLKVLSLEKFIKRISKDRFVNKRGRIILRILIKLINENYDFKRVYSSRRKYFELLESEDLEYGWRVKSPELIKFHEWFKAKMHS